MTRLQRHARRHLKRMRKGRRWSILTFGNSKIVKGRKKGVLTAVLHFAPARIAGVGNMCGKATKGCLFACLYTAGRSADHMLRKGEIFNASQVARVARTVWYAEDRASFMVQVVRDVEKLIRKADRAGLVPMLRLNGTSDLPWWKIKTDNGQTVFERFPGLTCYDYTKIPHNPNVPNYHLTFSLADGNERDAKKALDNGLNVAAVIRGGFVEGMTFWGYPCVDGDETDVRPYDPTSNHIVVLKPKGKARYDKSGFVREPGERCPGVGLRMLG